MLTPCLDKPSEGSCKIMAKSQILQKVVACHTIDTCANDNPCHRLMDGPQCKDLQELQLAQTRPLSLTK